MLTHQFVLVETDEGYILTVEKNKKQLLMQSCKTSEATSLPVVVEQTLGVKRKNPSTLQRICIDANPKHCTVKDVVLWIQETGIGDENFSHSV